MNTNIDVGCDPSWARNDLTDWALAGAPIISSPPQWFHAQNGDRDEDANAS